MPSDLLILRPWLMTMPWFSWAADGSPTSSIPIVAQHLGEEARVQQVQDGMLDAADVSRRPGIHALALATSNGPSVKSGEQ